ncbi:MAG: hypothetical protein AAGA72_05190 [Pseudomonadota bacterium]
MSMRGPFSVLAAVLRWLSGLSRHALLIALVAVVVSPIGPAMRWEYTYRNVYGERVYLHCVYVGSRGFFAPSVREGCPLMIVADSRKYDGGVKR